MPSLSWLASTRGFLIERGQVSLTMRIAILGAGGMGTALAIQLARTMHDVRLWGRDAGRMDGLARTRFNERHLPGIGLPANVLVTASPWEAMREVELVIAAVPTSFLRAVTEQIADQIPDQVPVLSVVKGIENGSFARPSQILSEVLGPRPICVLSGPSHAEELARGFPTSVVVAGVDENWNLRLQEALSNESFRVYTSPDLPGVELAGALKNILGVAAGICDGLGLGDNAKAALITRGLVEITRLGVRLGGRQATFSGLAGIGDVITTCYSRFGRNRAVGERIGRGETLETILAGMVDVAEGVWTTRSVQGLAARLGIEMPITSELYQILFEGKCPRTAASDLMARHLKVEWEL